MIETCRNIYRTPLPVGSAYGRMPKPEGLFLSELEFRRMSAFIHEQCGINLSPAKRTMLETRLQKRLRALGMTAFSQYFDYLFSPRGMVQELTPMINVITTNKTEFFREPAHFEYLVRMALPEIRKRSRPGQLRQLRLWSAGCSTGEEPYTLAMVLSEYSRQSPDLRFSILATDICTSALEKGKHGVYDEERIAPVCSELRRKYFMRSRDKAKRLVRVVPELRSRIRFRYLNFRDQVFDIPDRMDVIFCRNVIIYFERSFQEHLVRKFCEHMAPGGYLFLGHSETLNNLDAPLVQVAATIYRKTA